MKTHWHQRLQRLVRHPPGPLKAALFLFAMIFYSASAFMFFETEAKPELQWHDAVWWAVVTMTTVGFGDYFPATGGGRILAGFPTMLVGVGMLGYALGQVASFLIRAEAFNRKGFRVHKLNGHVLVCNYPSRARLVRVIDEIRAKENIQEIPVLLVDEHLEELDADLGTRLLFTRGNPTRTHVLQRASVHTASRAIVLARDPTSSHSDSFTATCCLTLKQLNPALRLVCECVDPENEESLRRAGSDGVVCVQDLAPGIMAHELEDPGVALVLHELTKWHEEVVNIFIVPIRNPAGRPLPALRDYCIRSGITLLGLRSAGMAVQLNPPSSCELQDGDNAIVLCNQRPQAIEL